jgi:hypothetical protein
MKSKNIYPKKNRSLTSHSSKLVIFHCFSRCFNTQNSAIYLNEESPLPRENSSPVHSYNLYRYPYQFSQEDVVQYLLFHYIHVAYQYGSEVHLQNTLFQVRWFPDQSWQFSLLKHQCQFLVAHQNPQEF